MTTKHCPSCLTVKPVSEYGRNRSKRDGLQDYCRPCNRAISRLSKRGTRLVEREQPASPFGDRDWFVAANMMWRPTRCQAR